MIDIHSHILYGVDDGPKNLEESVALLEIAARRGITDIISTSHAFHPQFHVCPEMVRRQTKELQKKLNQRHIPLKIHVGHEVHISEKTVEHCLSKQSLLLADSNYILLELPEYTVPAYTQDIIRGLLVHDITPIIAHPERNKSIAEKPFLLERLIRGGAVAQVTAGSLAGHFGRAVQHLSLELIRANLIHTYGSDVHNSASRPYLFIEGLLYLEKRKELDAIDLLLENNSRILSNQPLIVYEPTGVSTRKWWKFNRKKDSGKTECQ